MKYWTALVGLVVAGCSSTPLWVGREHTVEVSELARSSQCASPGAEPKVTLLPDIAAVQTWEQARGVELSRGLLPQGPFALVEMGERPTGGYGLAISRIAGLRGDTLVLHATFVAPRPEDVTTQALTAPCVLVSLPGRSPAAVELVDQDGQLRARSGGGA